MHNVTYHLVLLLLKVSCILHLFILEIGGRGQESIFKSHFFPHQVGSRHGTHGIVFAVARSPTSPLPFLREKKIPQTEILTIKASISSLSRTS